LLTAQDADIAGSLAIRLDELNGERRATEQAVQLQAEALAEELLTEDSARSVLVLFGEGWHEGVIGIVAGRLKDKYNRPVIVIAFDKEGRGKGSSRGVPGLSLGDIIQAARQEGLLLSGGGHDMAAGLSLHRDKLLAFTNFITQRARAAFGDAPPVRSFVASHTLSVAGCTSEITDWLEKVGPFGAGHPEPRFIITHCQLKNLRWVGSEKQHLSVQLDDKTARPLPAICFSAATTPLGRALVANPDPGPVSVLGRVRVDSFRGGGAVQLHIEDIAIGWQK
jgi:single-stranded-DNA-specific exonuclease